MRKFKITSSHSGTITFVQSQRMLEIALVHCARKAHPRSPVVITVQDVTPDPEPLKVGKPDWSKH